MLFSMIFSALPAMMGMQRGAPPENPEGADSNSTLRIREAGACSFAKAAGLAQPCGLHSGECAPCPAPHHPLRMAQRRLIKGATGTNGCPHRVPADG